MKNKILLTAQKELYRFFTDKRMVISALIFPCVVLYIVYAYLVPLIINISDNKEDAIIYAINPPAPIAFVYSQIDVFITQIEENEKDSVLENIAQKDGSFLIVFPENFIEKAIAFNTMTEEDAPEVFIYYNSLSAGYMETYAKILAGLNLYEKGISRKFDINLTDGGDLAEAEDSGRHILALILPAFLLLFVFQGAMAAAAEAITGEKERGTLATVFLTSIKPMELALGKILGLGFQAFLCGVSASLGLLLSLPRFISSFTDSLSLIQRTGSAFEFEFNFSQYSIAELGLFILLLFTAACFIVAVISIIAVNAKTVKEAQLFAYPMIIVLLFVCFITAFNNSADSSVYFYFIPICSSIQSINDIINQNWVFSNIAAAAGSNIIYVLFGCFLLSRLLNTKKIT